MRLKEGRNVTAKIIDLGLAKTLDESASEAGISSPGAFIGTPEFASPEQFAGVGVGFMALFLKTTSATVALSPLAVDSYLCAWAMRRTMFLARSFFKS
jgi:serine/threonine protein kinase